MRPIRSISVLMPTWQGMEFLERVLDGLAAQKLELDWDFTVFDSGSTDGTWEFLEERAQSFPVPMRLVRIHQVEFDHGDTRNHLAASTDGDLLVFLTQDAIPSDDRFLARLAKNFDDPEVGAAYCRNLPRPDAQLLTRVFSETDPGYLPDRREVVLPDGEAYAAMNAHEKRVLYNFNDVASAIRRELWERHPFPRTQFGEDVLMARALLEAGFKVVYDNEATVEHSHDYDAKECRSRASIDAKFNAEWLDRTCVASLSDARVLTERQLERDREALTQAGVQGAELERALGEAKALRSATFEGLYDGGRSEVRYPASTMREETKLKLLYVVHGFPPDTWAGTEIYTFNLALEMQKRGHEVCVLARVPAPEEGGPPDFSVEESEFQGLRILRLTHRLHHANLRESYEQPRAEAAFRNLLVREKPDLVHFQHLIHMSAGLVSLAKSMGLPTIVHLHDYWSICARVQLIRPDGTICDKNQGAGCFFCIKDNGLRYVGLAERLSRHMKPALRALAETALRRAKPGTISQRRSSDLRDVLDRQPYVLREYAAADLRISPSRFLREKLLESGAFDPRTLLYSDNGMRTDHVTALAKEPDPEGRVRFGFVGSLVWYKGGEVMVRAMRELRGKQAVLNVYGDFKPEQDEHHAELAKLAEGCAVDFRGRFDNARLSEVYAEIDVLVVPSVWYENSPITIHEAYLTRTPVLASDIGGMAEYVRDGVDGLHFRVGDASDLARKMARFVDEPNLAAELSHDFMTIKTIEENARETEFRYRALVCRDRDVAHGPRVLFDYAGVEDVARFGPVEVQGADMLLLRPGGAAVEYDLTGGGGGTRSLCVDVQMLAAESNLELGGRVLVDGNPIGWLPLMSSHGEDEVRRVEFDVELPVDCSRLRIEGVTESGDEPHLRLKRVGIIEREGDSA